MSKKFIFKLTPNNKNVIINTDVLLNGYKNVEYPIPFKQTSQLGYILDTDTFKFTDTTRKEQSLNAYPIKMEIDTYFKQIPFYGWNEHRSKNDNRYIYYFTPSVFNSEYDESNPKSNFKFITEDDHDIITIEPKEQGVYNTENTKGYYSCDYKITIKIYWSDDKSHANEINLSEINSTIGTYPLYIKITPIYLLDDEYYYKYLDNNIIPEHNNFNVRFLEINDTPADVLTNRDILAFDISVTFTDPKTQLSILENKIVNVSQQGFIGKRLGYVQLKQIYMDPIDIWSPKINITYTRSIENEANPKVDKTSTAEYYSFNIEDSFIANINNYNYTHVFLNDIIPSPTIDDIIEATLNSDSSLKNNLPSKNIIEDISDEAKREQDRNYLIN